MKELNLLQRFLAPNDPYINKIKNYVNLVSGAITSLGVYMQATLPNSKLTAYILAAGVVMLGFNNFIVQFSIDVDKLKLRLKDKITKLQSQLESLEQNSLVKETVETILPEVKVDTENIQAQTNV